MIKSHLIDPTLRCRSLAIRILAYNDYYPDMWRQGRWVEVQDEHGDDLGEIAITSPGAAHDAATTAVLADVPGVRVPAKLLTDDSFAALTGHSCQTPGCIAGNALQLTGQRYGFTYGVVHNFQRNLVVRWDGTSAYALDPDGTATDLPARAAELLCISRHVHDCSGYWDSDESCVEVDGVIRHNSRVSDLFDGENDRATVVRLMAIAYGHSEEEFEKLIAAEVELLAEMDEQELAASGQLTLDEAADAPTS